MSFNIIEDSRHVNFKLLLKIIQTGIKRNICFPKLRYMTKLRMKQQENIDKKKNAETFEKYSYYKREDLIISVTVCYTFRELILTNLSNT